MATAEQVVDYSIARAQAEKLFDQATTPVQEVSAEQLDIFTHHLQARQSQLQTRYQSREVSGGYWRAHTDSVWTTYKRIPIEDDQKVIRGWANSLTVDWYPAPFSFRIFREERAKEGPFIYLEIARGGKPKKFIPS